MPIGSHSLYLNSFVGKTRLQENDQVFRLEVIGEDCDNAAKELGSTQPRINDHPSMKRFLCRRTDKQQIEVVDYNEILDYLEEGLEEEGLHKYKTILGHSGPDKISVDSDRMNGRTSDGKDGQTTNVD